MRHRGACSYADAGAGRADGHGYLNRQPRSIAYRDGDLDSHPNPIAYRDASSQGSYGYADRHRDGQPNADDGTRRNDNQRARGDSDAARRGRGSNDEAPEDGRRFERE